MLPLVSVRIFTLSFSYYLKNLQLRHQLSNVFTQSIRNACSGTPDIKPLRPWYPCNYSTDDFQPTIQLLQLRQKLPFYPSKKTRDRCTAWKVFAFGVFHVRKFLYWVRILENMNNKNVPVTDTLQASVVFYLLHKKTF